MENAITGQHPEWANNEAFIEACVSNPKRVRVIKVHDIVWYDKKIINSSLLY